MPSKSKKQAKLMAAVAHNPEFAKKVNIPMSVGKDFNKADVKSGLLKGKSMHKAEPKEGMKHEKKEGMKFEKREQKRERKRGEK